MDLGQRRERPGQLVVVLAIGSTRQIWLSSKPMGSHFGWYVRHPAWSILCTGVRAFDPGVSAVWLWWSKPVWDPKILGKVHFRTYFSGDWDVNWGITGLLTHGHR